MDGDDAELIRRRLAALFEAARLPISESDLDRMVAVVGENQASARRVRELNARYDEPAFGLPDRRRT